MLGENFLKLEKFPRFSTKVLKIDINKRGNVEARRRALLADEIFELGLIIRQLFLYFFAGGEFLVLGEEKHSSNSPRVNLWA